ERVMPFQFLSRARRAALVERMDERRYRPGEQVVRPGERSRDVFLLEEGVVEFVDAREPPAVLSIVTAGHYFGERAALFEQPRSIGARARDEVVAWAIPGKDFLRLVDEEAVFAQALALTLKVKQGIFLGYRRLFA